MKRRKSAVVEISGHTDNVGNAKKNKALSMKRAQACRDYLISKGIEGNRITAVGYGGERPTVPNDTDENRQKNRRIEVVELQPPSAGAKGAKPDDSTERVGRRAPSLPLRACGRRGLFEPRGREWKWRPLDRPDCWHRRRGPALDRRGLGRDRNSSCCRHAHRDSQPGRPCVDVCGRGRDLDQPDDADRGVGPKLVVCRVRHGRNSSRRRHDVHGDSAPAWRMSGPPRTRA